MSGVAPGQELVGLALDLRTGVQQQPGDLQVAAGRCHDEGRGPAVRAEAASLQQPAAVSACPARRRPHQSWTSVTHTGARLRAILIEKANHFEVTAPRCGDQSVFAVVIAAVKVGAASHQHPRDLRLAQMDGADEKCKAVRIRLLNVSARLQKPLRERDIARDDPLLQPDGRSPLEQEPHDLGVIAGQRFAHGGPAPAIAEPGIGAAIEQEPDDPLPPRCGCLA